MSRQIVFYWKMSQNIVQSVASAIIIIMIVKINMIIPVMHSADFNFLFCIIFTSDGFFAVSKPKTYTNQMHLFI